MTLELPCDAYIRRYGKSFFKLCILLKNGIRIALRLLDKEIQKTFFIQCVLLKNELGITLRRLDKETRKMFFQIMFTSQKWP